MTVRVGLAGVPLVVWLVTAACGGTHEVERAAPVGSSCPEESLAEASGTPTDTLSLRWYRALHERDRRLAGEWCGTVGEPVIQLDPAPIFPEWRASSPLEIVTWNMAIGRADLFRFLRDEMGLDCMAPTPRLAPGARPFVVLLQEAWRYSEDLPYVESSWRIPWTVDSDRTEGEDPDIVEAAERCGLSVVYVPSARNGPDTDSRPQEDKGNAILSTVPLTAPIAIDLPLEGGRKVAVAATLYASRGERVRVVSVHLDVASTLVRALLTGNQTRVRQTRGLIDGLRKAEDDGPLAAITLVGADMNTWAGNETSLKLMWEAFPHSPPYDGLGTGRGDFPLDHIFFRRGSFRTFSIRDYERIEERYGSDHNPRRLSVVYSPPPSGE